MLTADSALRQALDDTLIDEATGYAFDRLAVLYGFPRVFGFSAETWRGALQEVAFGPRGTLDNVMNVLEAIFTPWDEIRTVTRTANTLVSASNWQTYHEGRFVRFTDTDGVSSRYYSRNTAAAALPGTTLPLVRYGSSYWAAPASPVVTGTARVLPFLVEEPRPCEFRVLLDRSIWSTPPTYLQTDGTIDRTAAAPGQPYGGHLLENALALGNQTDGPFPIYLTGDDIPGGLKSALDALLASGIELVLVPHEFGA